MSFAGGINQMPMTMTMPITPSTDAGVELNSPTSVLHKLLEKTEKASCKWFNVGLSASVDMSLLGRIQQDNRGDVAACYRGILLAMLKGHFPNPMPGQCTPKVGQKVYLEIMTTLIKAFRSSTVALNVLADDLNESIKEMEAPYASPSSPMQTHEPRGQTPAKTDLQRETERCSQLQREKQDLEGMFQSAQKRFAMQTSESQKKLTEKDNEIELLTVQNDSLRSYITEMERPKEQHSALPAPASASECGTVTAATMRLYQTNVSHAKSLDFLNKKQYKYLTNYAQNAFYPFRISWKQIGNELGLTSDTIESIQINNFSNVDDCFRAMINTALGSNITNLHELLLAIVKATQLKKGETSKQSEMDAYNNYYTEYVTKQIMPQIKAENAQKTTRRYPY